MHGCVYFTLIPQVNTDTDTIPQGITNTSDIILSAMYMHTYMNLGMYDHIIIIHTFVYGEVV